MSTITKARFARSRILVILPGTADKERQRFSEFGGLGVRIWWWLLDIHTNSLELLPKLVKTYERRRKTKIHADLPFQACISFLRCFRTPGSPRRIILGHAGMLPLSCPFMASKYANLYLVPIAFLMLTMPWILHPISFCSRISRFVAFQTKVEGCQKGGFPRGWFWRTCPRSGFSFRGTCKRTLVQVFVPGEYPPKPPFWKTTLLATPPKMAHLCFCLVRLKIPLLIDSWDCHL